MYRDQYKNIVWKDLETEESDILITNRTLVSGLERLEQDLGPISYSSLAETIGYKNVSAQHKVTIKNCSANLWQICVLEIGPGAKFHINL